MRRLATVAIVLGASAAPAFARPVFVTLDRQDLESRAGADVSLVSLENNDDALYRLDVHGQYVNAASRAGGYLALPLSYITGDTKNAVLGNLEIGGIYVPDVDSPTTDLVLHAGVILPTAREQGAGAFVGIAGGYVRPTDLYQTLPETTTLRVGVSPLIRVTPTTTLRIDTGLDLDIDGGVDDNVSPALHINVGVGFAANETTSLAFELVTQTVILDEDTETNTVGAFALRFDADRVLPYVALVVPLDDGSSSVIDIALTLGLEGRL